MKHEIYVVITESDGGEAFMNGGAIVMETYTRKAGLVEAVKKAESFGIKNGAYGRVWVGHVHVMGELEEVKNELLSNKGVPEDYLQHEDK